MQGEPGRSWTGGCRRRAMMLALLLSPAAFAADQRLDGFSLEQLANLEITSVSKGPEALQKAPAAIYVITQDDIARSGVTSIPEALRLAPNLLITQFSSHRYVAGARGFGGAEEAQNFSNKLLILIDGRSVYSPLFSGVYLDVQDVMLEDIDRIEVISGPGAMLWGANAMNGVINIITRPAYLTDSGVAKLAAGPDEREIGARIGQRLDNGLSYRVYGKAFQRDSLKLANGADADDEWQKLQGGFRADWTRAADTITVQADAYDGKEGQFGAGDVDLEGGNLLGRWQHKAGRAEWQLQGWYDYSYRAQPADGLALKLRSFDLELQQRLAGPVHRIVWGVGTRLHHYEVGDDASQALRFDPGEKDLWLGNVFLQDNIRISGTLDLSLGLKLERATYSGWSPLPDIRLAWQPNDRSLLWAAASRAVRAVTPFDHDVVESIPGAVLLTGNSGFETEKVNAYEIGYRGRHADRLTYSISVFHNDYDDLKTVELVPNPQLLELRWDNLQAGRTWGVEGWAKWCVTSWWRLSPGFRTLRKNLHYKSGATGLLSQNQSGNDPEHQALLSSSMDIGRTGYFELALRHVGELPEPALGSYRELNASIGMKPWPGLQVSLSGFNLLRDEHQEYPGAELIGRNVVAQLRWSF